MIDIHVCTVGSLHWTHLFEYLKHICKAVNFIFDTVNIFMIIILKINHGTGLLIILVLIILHFNILEIKRDRRITKRRTNYRCKY